MMGWDHESTRQIQTFSTLRTLFSFKKRQCYCHINYYNENKSDIIVGRITFKYSSKFKWYNGL